MPVAPDIFHALGDPTRREIFESLATSGPTTATRMSNELEITRQAVAKHLQVLTQAGMASSARIGRETRFTAELNSLGELLGWVNQVETAWSLRLDALKATAESLG